MPTDEQRERAITYRDAAAEHTVSAVKLYREQRYALANYVAGLAVECIFRAYRHMIDPAFDARHDLEELFNAAEFHAIVPEGKAADVGAWLTTASTLWSNDHRFLSVLALRRKWKRMRLDRRVKGDFVKERTRQLTNASVSLVDLGVARWESFFGN